jgi:hypothetical protein
MVDKAALGQVYFGFRWIDSTNCSTLIIIHHLAGLVQFAI